MASDTEYIHSRRVEGQSLLDSLRHNNFFPVAQMLRFATQKSMIFVKCGLTYSESEYVFCCYAVKPNSENTTALQGKSVSTACTIYLVYMPCLT